MPEDGKEGAIIKEMPGGRTRPISKKAVLIGSNCEASQVKEAYFIDLYKEETRAPNYCSAILRKETRQIRET